MNNFTPPDSPLNTSSSSYIGRHDHEEIGLSTPHRDDDDNVEDMTMTDAIVLSTPPIKDADLDFSMHSLPANLFSSPPKTLQQQQHNNNVQHRFFGEELTPVIRNITDHHTKHYYQEGNSRMTQTGNHHNNNISMLVSPEEGDNTNTLTGKVDLSLPTESSDPSSHDRPYFVTPNLKSKRQFQFRSMRGGDSTTTIPTLKKHSSATFLPLSQRLSFVPNRSSETNINKLLRDPSSPIRDDENQDHGDDESDGGHLSKCNKFNSFTGPSEEFRDMWIPSSSDQNNARIPKVSPFSQHNRMMMNQYQPTRKDSYSIGVEDNSQLDSIFKPSEESTAQPSPERQWSIRKANHLQPSYADDNSTLDGSYCQSIQTYDDDVSSIASLDTSFVLKDSFTGTSSNQICDPCSDVINIENIENLDKPNPTMIHSANVVHKVDDEEDDDGVQLETTSPSSVDMNSCGAVKYTKKERKTLLRRQHREEKAYEWLNKMKVSNDDNPPLAEAASSRFLTGQTFVQQQLSDDYSPVKPSNIFYPRKTPAATL